MQRVGSRSQVMHGNAKMTAGGLRKKDLKYNKQGKIVSKKMSQRAKKEKRLQKAGYITKKGQFGVIRIMKGGRICDNTYCQGWSPQRRPCNIKDKQINCKIYNKDKKKKKNIYDKIIERGIHISLTFDEILKRWTEKIQGTEINNNDNYLFSIFIEKKLYLIDQLRFPNDPQKFFPRISNTDFAKLLKIYKKKESEVKQYLINQRLINRNNTPDNNTTLNNRKAVEKEIKNNILQNEISTMIGNYGSRTPVDLKYEILSSLELKDGTVPKMSGDTTHLSISYNIQTNKTEGKKLLIIFQNENGGNAIDGDVLENMPISNTRDNFVKSSKYIYKFNDSYDMQDFINIINFLFSQEDNTVDSFDLKISLAKWSTYYISPTRKNVNRSNSATSTTNKSTNLSKQGQNDKRWSKGW